MYLKSLEMHGFKSFADRVKLEFGRGITAVVGPNGSGKSNISDAVRWVLGEQSVKALRGAKMEDVIFTGTEHRKPLGYAEVTLVIDNSDRQLNVDYTEVAISRRLYRSGESEYLLNKTPCRLKDITALLMDTGIGREGYSLIGQGRVAEILGSKSEDRRALFEEAAGITKYKTRKLEAEKKLENTKQNLIRIGDIINEIGLRLDPLKIQAEKAKKYMDLSGELKKVEVRLLTDNIAKALDRLKSAEADLKIARDNISDENEKLNKISHENQMRSERLKIVEEKTEKARGKLFFHETQIEKLNSEISLNEEKHKSYITNAERLKQEEEENRNKISDFDLKVQENKRKKDNLCKQLSELNTKMNGLKAELEVLISELDREERSVEELKEKVMGAIDLAADKKNQINSISNYIIGIDRQKGMLDNEINRLLSEINNDNVTKEELENSLSRNGAIIRELEEKKRQLENARRELLAEAEKLNRNLNNVKSEITYKSSRLKMLEDMEKSLEGYSKSVRAVLSGYSSRGGICGAVAQLIRTDARYETAIEAALGGSLQHIVVKTEEDAQNAIEHLKKTGSGRATFLPVTSVKGYGFEQERLRDIKACPGFVAIASDLLEYSPEFEGIIRYLLGKVVVVKDMDSAIKMARKFRYSFKIATIEGEIFNAGGSISGGGNGSSAGRRGSSLLGRIRETGELKKALANLSGTHNKTEAEIKEMQNILVKNASELDETIKTLNEKELEKVRDERHIAQIDTNVQNYSSRIKMLEAEKGQLERQKSESISEKEKYLKELQSIEKEIADNKELIAASEDSHKESRKEHDRLHSDITDCRISINSINDGITGVDKELMDISNGKIEITSKIDRKKEERQRYLLSAESIMERNRQLQNEIKAEKESIAGAGLELEALLSEKQALDEEMSEMIESMTSINKNISLLNEDLNRLESRKSRLLADTDQLRSRLWDNYEITYNEALEYVASLEQENLSTSQIQKKVDKLKAAIKELGSVNLSSVSEYEELKERYDFLTTQQHDMIEAGKKLRKIIADMQEIMKSQFIEHFKIININFNNVFRELFDGGSAYLSLEDENNVLECGIEIAAQPPGKKLQSMSLFSGGEKSLIAIALLFATIRMHPVPFCILDEIEAALDEVNLTRFTQYIKKYENSTQFILVTHRKATMEAADVLYGVTMEERGISKVVSMKL